MHQTLQTEVPLSRVFFLSYFQIQYTETLLGGDHLLELTKNCPRVKTESYHIPKFIYYIFSFKKNTSKSCEKEHSNKDRDNLPIGWIFALFKATITAHMFIVLFIFIVNVQFNVLWREIQIIRMLLNWKST